jgi:hypothetical protein
MYIVSNPGRIILKNHSTVRKGPQSFLLVYTDTGDTYAYFMQQVEA